MVADRVVDQALAWVSQNNQFTATVLGVGAAHHQPGALQPIETVGHAARGKHRCFIKLGWRKHVGRDGELQQLQRDRRLCRLGDAVLTGERLDVQLGDRG